MGYDVHITRASHWVESEAEPIALEEWLRFVEADPEMRHDGHAEATAPGGETIRVEQEGLAVWLAWPRHSPSAMAWFMWSSGRVIVKNPGPDILAKMRSIAAQLGAKVFGDDGEEYAP